MPGGNEGDRLVSAPTLPSAPASLSDGEGRLLPILTRREIGWAILGCVLAATLFLSPALFSGRIFSPADLLFGYYPWRTQLPPGWTVASNAILSDAVLQVEPWLTYT